MDDDEDCRVEVFTRVHDDDDEPSFDQSYPSKKIKGPETITPLSPFDQAMEFARAGDRDSLRRQFNTGVLNSINLTNDKSETLLMIASSEGRLDCVDMLLDFGANLAHNLGSSYMCRDRLSPLSLASQYGHIDIVKLLLLRGAEVNSSNSYNASALIAACEGGHHDIVACLLDAGADINVVQGKLGTALRAACHHGHIAVIKLLLTRGANIDLTDRQKSTALMAACKANKSEVVAILLEHKADIFLVDLGGHNALNISCAAGATEATELLLQAGADVTASVSIDSFKGTLLGYACYKSNFDLMRLLVRYGALVDATDDKGNTVLIQMCKSGENAMSRVKVLLELHADINKPDRRGQTPLMIACSRYFFSLVETLLDAGAAIDAVDDLGRTALFHAADTSVLHQLLSRGANIDVVSKFRGSAFFANVVWKRWDMALSLLEHGAELHGNTVSLISRARRGDRPTIVVTLLDREVAGPLFGIDIARLDEDQTTYPDVTKLNVTTAAIEVEAPADGSKLTYRDVCVRIKSGEITSLRGASRAAFTRDFANPNYNHLMTAYSHNRLGMMELILECRSPYRDELLDEIKGLRATLLVDACLKGQFDAVRVILESGADANTVDAHGRNALIAIPKTRNILTSGHRVSLPQCTLPPHLLSTWSSFSWRTELTSTSNASTTPPW